MTYTDAREAIHVAARLGAHCVGWNQAKSRWNVYNPVDGAPEGFSPEFFCPGVKAENVAPVIPLNDGAIDVLYSVKRVP